MTIHIEQLRFGCIIGVLDFERLKEQQVIIDLELEYDFQGTYINYAELSELIETSMKTRRFELIEEALESLFSQIKKRFPLTKKLFLKISKPDILPNCRVCVSNIKIY